ncbi:MAG: hypothetical protein K0R38_2392 [Polyangiaceae bacterium]|nr:hypothetical protein [Polyangiaceae bacterium]
MATVITAGARVNRRDFLRASALGGAASFGAATWARRGNALTFGEVPTLAQSSLLPAALRVENVLECYLFGGLDPWDSFYCRPGLGEVGGTFAYTAYDHLIKASEGCGFDNAGSEPFTYFAKDSAQEEIFFGPYMRRLLTRPDVMKRLRVVITRHRDVLHEYGSALASTGRAFGNPAGAGLTTHVNRYFVDRDSSSNRVLPYAYDLSTGGGTFTAGVPIGFAAQGLHPSRARPLQIRVDDLARMQRLLARPNVGTTTERGRYDALIEEYFHQYEQSLRPRAGGEILRAPQFEDLRQAFSKQAQTDLIRGVVLENEVAPLMTPAMCRQVVAGLDGEPQFVNGDGTSPGNGGNLPAMGLALATRLLTHPTHPAKYCVVSDIGVKQADGGGGYDVHSEGPWRQASNLNNLLEHLLGFVNAPGQADPRKLSLDKTLIILNTEFGRSPGPQSPGRMGRAHWPHGFAQIYIGGPIREGGAGCHGHIDEAGNATTFATPAENRIAALLALGIYPFDGEGVAFSPADVQAQTEGAGAARSVIERIFGLQV